MNLYDEIPAGAGRFFSLLLEIGASLNVPVPPRPYAYQQLLVIISLISYMHCRIPEPIAKQRMKARGKRKYIPVLEFPTGIYHCDIAVDVD